LIKYILYDLRTIQLLMPKTFSTHYSRAACYNEE